MKVTTTWRGCLRLTAGTVDRTPSPSHLPEGGLCGELVSKKGHPSLPLRFLVDEQMHVSLLEAG